MVIRFFEAPAQNIRNGNVVTSERWRLLLEALGHRVVIGQGNRGENCDVLVVFNAYKNRQAIRRARITGAAARIVICLTGTDLYQDLKNDPAAADILYLADRLVVLQPMALLELPPDLRDKTSVLLQSAVPSKQRRVWDAENFDVCVIAHLREIKDPLRTARAARLLPPESRIRVLHVGKALSDEMARAAALEADENPRFRWLGEQSGESTAHILLQSRALVLSSFFEGGANVISEAVVCGVPVIASDIPCVRGLLGADYPGLFPVGDTQRLAELLLRLESDSEFYEDLAERCRRESYRFHPDLEREGLATLLELVSG